MTLENYLENQLNKSTISNYLYEINRFKKYAPNHEKCHYPQLMQYIGFLRNYYQPKTIKRVVYALKKYYDYLIEIKVRKDNPAHFIKLRDAKQTAVQLQDLWTEKELKTLLEPRKERYAILAKRNQIILSLFVYQAILVKEITQILLEDIDLDKAEIYIRETGMTNSRTLSLKAEQILLFYHYLQEDRPQLERTKQSFFILNKLGNPTTADDINYLLSTYQKQVDKRLTSVKIRQSVITNLLSQGHNLRAVQLFCGHKFLDTTEKYKQSGIKALQDAIDKHHPLQ